LDETIQIREAAIRVERQRKTLKSSQPNRQTPEYPKSEKSSSFLDYPRGGAGVNRKLCYSFIFCTLFSRVEPSRLAWRRYPPDFVRPATAPGRARTALQSERQLRD
jgi:hypothetical protein